MPCSTLTAREEKSMPGFKTPEADLLGANAAGDFKIQPGLTYCSENPRALRNYAQSTSPVLYEWNDKAWMTVHLFTTRID